MGRELSPGPLHQAARERSVPWRRARSVGTPGRSSWSTYAERPAMLITNARVDPVTSGPVPVANGPSFCAQMQTGGGGAAGNGEVAARKELGHRGQCVDRWCAGQPERTPLSAPVHGTGDLGYHNET